MEITPDHLVLFRWGFVHLNATILYTWIVMLLLAAISWLATRSIVTGAPASRWTTALEAVVCGIRGQIREISGGPGSDVCIPFIGTLFLFITVSNELDVVPGWHAPTGSLSTTAGLALCVAVSVPFFGIRNSGLRGYLHHYASPTFFMVPFHVMSEIARTVALAIRLFGNIMSGYMIVAILLTIAPLFFPVAMQALGLLIGLIQAYIFSILAMVYIAAAFRRQEDTPHPQPASAQATRRGVEGKADAAGAAATRDSETSAQAARRGVEGKADAAGAAATRESETSAQATRRGVEGKADAAGAAATRASAARQSDLRKES